VIEVYKNVPRFTIEREGYLSVTPESLIRATVSASEGKKNPDLPWKAAVDVAESRRNLKRELQCQLQIERRDGERGDPECNEGSA